MELYLSDFSFPIFWKALLKLFASVPSKKTFPFATKYFLLCLATFAVMKNVYGKFSLTSWAMLSNLQIPVQ
jgi:ABC-type antimicrobial peptide transport system permease subunit